MSTIAVQIREKLHPRREGTRVEIVCKLGENSRHFDAQFNFYPDGRLAEVFCRPFRTGMELEEQLDRFCLTLSVALQTGTRIGVLATMTGDSIPLPVQPGGTERVPGNIFGMIIRAGVEAEQERMRLLADLHRPEAAQ